MAEDPVGSSCKSVVLNMIAGVSGTVYQLTNYLSGAPIDATSGMYMPLQMSQTVRQTVGNNIYEGLGGGILGTAGNIAYQGIMGVGDYGLATMTGLGIVLMGMEGYAQTGQDAAERDLSASDIQAEAVAGAIAEIITERILSGIPGGKSAASHGIQLLKAGVSNVVNSFAVWELDKYIAEDLSYEELLLQSYITAGEGKEEARQQVIQDRLKQAAMDFGVGAVTAGIVDVAKTVGMGNQKPHVQRPNDYLSYSKFRTLDRDKQIKVFAQMSSDEVYNLVKESPDSWAVESYDLITPENAKDFICINENSKGETAFNLRWPKYGGYDPSTISSIGDLSGKVPVSRDGGDSGYTMGYGQNPDGTYDNNSRRSIPKSSAEVNTGVFDIDLYKKTVDIVASEDRSSNKVQKLNELGIPPKIALKMIGDYNSWLTRTEIVGRYNIAEGANLFGKTINSQYGYYGQAAQWNVANLKMVGGAGQMNTVYSWGTLKKAGIVSELGYANIN